MHDASLIGKGLVVVVVETVGMWKSGKVLEMK